MISLGLVYLLTSAVLFVIAVVVHFDTDSLFLPVSPVLSVLTVILPIAGLLNAYIYPSLLYASRHEQPTSASGSSSSPTTLTRLHRLIPLILQVLQAIVTAILATLLLQGVVPSQILHCVLEARWSSMFRAHDAQAIQHIQDRLYCCGLNSVKDRAYPFPDTQASTCAQKYRRNLPCVGPWTAAMRANAGADLAVVVAVGLLQIFGLLMMTEGTSWWTAWRTGKWPRFSREPESGQSLLNAAEHHSDDEEFAAEQDAQRPSYGTTEREPGPRLEPSPIHEANAWRDQ